LRENWAVYESFLLKASRSNPTVIPATVQILVSYHQDGYALGRARVEKFVEDIVCKNAPLGQHAEVSWALFLAKSLALRLSTRAARAVSGLENSVTALIALDLRQRG
jgi:hypothetical protein